jgi:hypothetical protein
LGSIFPKVNSIAGPIVCGNQKLDISQYTASCSPGSADTTTTFSCADLATGEKKDVTLLIGFVAGMIYSLIIAAIIIIWGKISQWNFGKYKAQKLPAACVLDLNPYDRGLYARLGVIK